MMLMGFAAREALHIAAYSHLIETLGMPESTYNEFLEYQEMRDKHDYVTELSSKNGTLASTATHIAVFSAFTEGMQLFSSFIMLLNFPRHGIMKGMGQIVAWSVRDETLHTNSIIKLFKAFISENPELWNEKMKKELTEICRVIVEHEDAFIDLAFEIDGYIRGLVSSDVKKYIRYIADHRLSQLGLDPIYNIGSNPLPWMDEILNAPEHTNFFENRATDYAKAAHTGSWDDVWGRAA
jgi:ribonucleoside-diphosphate reductase beta chain